MLILASQSPRRRELIKQITSDFVVIPSNADESSLHVPASDMALELSKLKAYDVAMKHPNDDVLACDTVVIYNNLVLGKPKNEEDAYNMLKMLSGHKHVVISGYTFISKNKEVSRSVRTYVYFNELSDELIKEYIKSGSPMDKAGAYGIQDKQFNLVKSIEGSYYNVVGFPLEDIKRHVFNIK
ncbi:MAG: Maf family protein [Bacillales bacterium]|nr:Maf family protein [Bacillales bacterium]